MSQILIEIKPDLSAERLQSLATEHQEKPAAVYQLLGSMVPAFAIAIHRHPQVNQLLTKLGQTSAQSEHCWQTRHFDFIEMPALIWGENLQAVSHSFAAFAAVKPSIVLALMPEVCAFWACFLQKRTTEESKFVAESNHFLEHYSVDFQSLVSASVAPYLGLMPSERSDLSGLQIWSPLKGLLRAVGIKIGRLGLWLF